MIINGNNSLVLVIQTVGMYEQKNTCGSSSGGKDKMRWDTLKLTLCYLAFQILPQAGEQHERKK